MRAKLIKIGLLITGVFMLVLSVLPHHHHNELICFSVVDCVDHIDNESQHNDNKCNHSEDGCGLHQLFVISARDDHQQVFCTCGDDHHQSERLQILAYIYASSDTDLASPLELWVSIPPQVGPLCPSYNGRVGSLRAPPLFIA